MSGSLLIKAAINASREAVEQALHVLLGESLHMMHMETSPSGLQCVTLEVEATINEEKLPECTMLELKCKQIANAIDATVPGSVLWMNSIWLNDIRWFYGP